MHRQTIGRYQIREELGRGAMGVVFRAEDSVIGRTVAIKTIPLDSFSDPAERDKLKDRLLREARSAGLLSHRNIVTVYDVGEEGGVAFIAMEFVPGQTLEQALREHGRLERERLTGLLTEVAAALDYAHSQGVVHRDVKPGNLMLASDGSVRVTDFGVAKLLSHQATQSDMMLGTPNYMAPEQIDARGVDGRTDQFALAVIAYELLTGERPFHAEALSALLFKILREDPTPPHLLNASLNERVSAVLARALAKQPADRFATCSAFAKALGLALSSCGNWQPLARSAASSLATVVAPAAAAAVDPAPMPVIVDAPAFTNVDAQVGKSGRWPLVMTAVVLAAAAVGIAGYWLYPSWKPGPVVSASQSAPAPQPPSTNDSRPSPLSAPEPPPATDRPVETATTTAAGGTQTVKPAVPAGGPVSGVVEMGSDPPGASVRIDDTRDQCKTPCSLELSQGRHVLHFALDGYRSGTLVVMVPQESSAGMRLDPLSGTLMIHTTPPGAAILLNGVARKEVSPATIRLTPGKYTLTLRRDGARERTQEIEVRDEAISQVEYSWP